MARANRNTLRHSHIDEARQQRHEQPHVAGTPGTPTYSPPDSAEKKPRQRASKKPGEPRRER